MPGDELRFVLITSKADVQAAGGTKGRGLSDCSSRSGGRSSKSRQLVCQCERCYGITCGSRRYRGTGICVSAADNIGEGEVGIFYWIHGKGEKNAMVEMVGSCRWALSFLDLVTKAMATKCADLWRAGAYSARST